MTSHHRIELSEPAELDLLELLNYSLEQWGKEQPVAYADRIEHALDSLARYPNMGVTCDELLSGSRRLKVEQHWIYYQLIGDVVYVVRILHQSVGAVRHLLEHGGC
ncbi:MAG: type II toxin-antitoxin system RelE/ParE family toxin [Thermomicrobiales bacterium]|nr:type II toxin-antitoxin system RelE/ParE family toxin [Thermomicrobiales bacterium]